MKILRKIAVIFLTFIIGIFSYIPYVCAYATTEGTNVLDDLTVDESFDKSLYPSMTYDKAIENNQELLQLIQLAETDDGYLALYFYVPTSSSLPITATSVNISYGYSARGDDLSPKVYDLELLSADGVFAKYLVKGFTVKDDVERYYNVVSVNRKFIDTIDSAVSGSVSSEPGIPIGQQWCCYYLNGDIVYECGTFDVLEIDVKCTGNFEFSDGITWGALLSKFSYGDSWFICFDLKDYVASHIYDADLVYRMREVTTTKYHEALEKSDDVETGEWSDDIPITLTDVDEVTYDGGGLFAKEYTWNRIMSSEDFIKNAEEQKITISDEVKADILNSQWVFSFCETAKTSDSFFSGAIVHYECHKIEAYEIADVEILRIHFLNFDNKIYDLGVVSSKVSPDNVSDGYGGTKDIDDIFVDLNEFLKNLKEFFGKILGILGLVLIGVLLAPLLIVIFKAVSNLLAWIISAIGSLFKRKK